VRSQFWTLETDETAEDRFMVDAVYVDDEALVLLSKSPKALAVAMESLLDILTSVFSSFHLGINWSKGKTEGTIALRGHHAVNVREKWRHADGSLGILVPNPDKILTVQAPRDVHFSPWKNVPQHDASGTVGVGGRTPPSQ